jgi:hypothetical protein
VPNDDEDDDDDDLATNQFLKNSEKYKTISNLLTVALFFVTARFLLFTYIILL